MTFKNLKVMIKCDYELIQLRGKIVDNTNLAYSYQDYEMIEGYRRSMKCDKENNIYNPLVSGNWNYQLIKNKLIWEINKKVIPNLDWILSNNSLGIW